MGRKVSEHLTELSTVSNGDSTGVIGEDSGMASKQLPLLDNAPPWAKALARRVRLLRGDESLEKFGQRFGLSRVSVYHWEIGKTQPSLENLELLSREFGVSIDWLMGRGPDDLAEQARATSDVAPAMDRDAMMLATAAVCQVAIDTKRLPTPDHLASLVAATHDWIVAHDKDGTSPPSFSDAVSFLRGALQLADSLNRKT